MNSILEKIISRKREEVASLKRARPLSELKKIIRDMPAGNSFLEAIVSRECALIAEIKRRSPSRGSFGKDLDHLALARIYKRNGAAAISVLTDREFFGGGNDDLSEIRKVVKIPLLRKDFVVDPVQIYESKAIGADAVLLIARILSGTELRDFIQLAVSLGLSTLVEVRSLQELESALSAGTGIIGINNRNLHTFQTDLNTTLELLPFVTPEIITVSESGIETRTEIEKLMKAGARAFLVGEALVTARDPAAKLRELLGK